MPLTLRRTGLSPPSEDRQDWTVFSGEWAIGRIYEERGTPDHMRWFWSFHGTNVPATISRSGHVPTFEEAKHQFSASWEAWKAWAKLAESKGDAKKPGTVAKPGGLPNRDTEQVMADKPNGHVATTIEPARMDGTESFVTDEGKINLIVDPEEPGGWRVEFLENDASGNLHFTVFAGPMAERRARDYFDALKSGTLQIVREDDRDSQARIAACRSSTPTTDEHLLGPDPSLKVEKHGPPPGVPVFSARNS